MHNKQASKNTDLKLNRPVPDQIGSQTFDKGSYKQSSSQGSKSKQNHKPKYDRKKSHGSQQNQKSPQKE